MPGKDKIMANNFKSTAELRGLLADRQSDAEKKLGDGKLSAHARMALLFDEGTFVEVGAYIRRKKTELDLSLDEDFEPVVTGYGAVDGTLVYAFSQDYSRLSGALGEAHAKKIADIYDMALRSEAPIVGVFDSAGAKILEGVDALAGYGKIMEKASASKTAIPQIAVIAGPCGGASAVIAKMFDIIITTENGSLYIVPASVCEDKEIGTPARLYKEGASAFAAKDEAEALALVRRLIPYFGTFIDNTDDASRAVDIDTILSNENYEVRDVIAEIADAGSFIELSAGHARHMVTGLASINSRVVGIVATDPAVKGGALCPCAVEKAADFIDMCSGFEIPVLTLVDTVGVPQKEHIEEKGISEKLAHLAVSYTGGLSPKVTVVLGKAFGTAYTVLGSRSLGADVAFALDRAEIAPMAPERAVEFLGDVTDESKKTEIASEWAEKFASPLEAAKNGHIDDIIEASELRARIAASLEMLAF